MEKITYQLLDAGTYQEPTEEDWERGYKFSWNKGCLNIRENYVIQCFIKKHILINPKDFDSLDSQAVFHLHIKKAAGKKYRTYECRVKVELDIRTRKL